MRRYTIAVNGIEHVVEVEETSADTFQVFLDDEAVEVHLVDHEDLAQAAIAPTIEAHRVAGPAPTGAARPAASAYRSSNVTPAPAAAAPKPPAPTGPAGPPTPSDSMNAMTAPMPGVVLSIEAAPGAQIARGDLLMVLEAMKMKNELRATRDGVIASVPVQVGAQVKYGEVLVTFEGA